MIITLTQNKTEKKYWKHSETTFLWEHQFEWQQIPRGGQKEVARSFSSTDAPWLVMGLRLNKHIVSGKYRQVEYALNTLNLPNIIAQPSPHKMCSAHLRQPTGRQNYLTQGAFYKKVLNIPCNLLRVLLSHHHEVKNL